MVRAQSARRRPWLVLALLVTLAIVPFLPVLGNGFVDDWDDNRNFVHNPNYRGFGARQLRWMFTTFLAAHYFPVTWLSFALDHTLWGLRPSGYHLTSLLLHAGTTLVFYAVAVRLLAAAGSGGGTPAAARLGGAVAAALFAVHPLRVEPVAWATARSEILCALFYLSAVLAYLRAWQGSAGKGLWRRGWYWAALGLGTLALLSKSMAMSLPVVLVILDVYPLRRLGGSAGWFGPAARGVWAEKVPFVVLSEAAGVIALTGLAHLKGSIPAGWTSITNQLAISFYSPAFLLAKILMPVNLSPLYSLPMRMDAFTWPYVTSAALVAALTLAAFLLRRRWPAFTAIWASYLAMLLPVVGIVQHGWQIAADRYTYLAGSGFMLLAGGLAASWEARGGERRHRARAILGATALIVVILGVLTWRQTHIWRDARSLWTHAVATYPSVTAHYNLAVILFRQGEAADAMAHYRSALAITPDFAEAHNNLAVALAREGQVDEAIRHYREAVRLRPGFPEAHHNLGMALLSAGRPREAIEHFRRALEISPGFGAAQRSLDRALAESQMVR